MTLKRQFDLHVLTRTHTLQHAMNIIIVVVFLTQLVFLLAFWQFLGSLCLYVCNWCVPRHRGRGATVLGLLLPPEGHSHLPQSAAQMFVSLCQFSSLFYKVHQNLTWNHYIEQQYMCTCPLLPSLELCCICLLLLLVDDVSRSSFPLASSSLSDTMGWGGEGLLTSDTVITGLEFQIWEVASLYFECLVMST